MILFYNSYGKIFTSDILSLSTIVSLVFLFLLIFIPLFIAYSTEDFWQRLKICQEQPYVKLNKKFFISTLELEENSKVNSSKFYTSSNEINSQLLSLSDNETDYLLKGVTIGISNIDENGDSYNDKIEIKLSFVLPDVQTKLKNIKMMFFFDYYLIKKARFYTESMMYLDIDTPNGENRIVMNGELVLKQKSPIAQMSIPKVLKDKYLFGDDRESPYDMLALYNKYSSKNITTKFEGDVFLSPNNTNNTNSKVDIILNVYIPKSQDVLYYASVAETIKEAWIQYIYFFIPIYFLIHFILSFILRNRVFPCSVQSDIEGDEQDIY